MSNIIDKIQVSGVTYDLPSGGGGNATVELTQAVYDAMVSAGTVSANTYYIITDAQEGDLSKYWTSAQTQSAITQSTSGKVDSSSVVSSVTSASTDSEIPTAKAVWDVASQGGGGKAIEAGRGITVTSGETADTVSFNLPISAGTGTGALIIASDTYDLNNKAKGHYSVCFNGGGLHPNNAKGTSSFAQGMDTKAYGNACHSEGYASKAGVENNINIQFAHAEGDHTEAKGTASHTEGSYTRAYNNCEHASGQYNNSVSASTTFGDSGNTLFSVGNGTADNARHNAFEIRQNGDIYCSDGTNDVKLQDTITATAANTTALGGLSLVKLTQSAYDALSPNYDSNTLYVIVN